MLTKQPRYFFDQWGEREPCETDPKQLRHLRDVWAIDTTKGYKGHSAAFPLALPRRCIRLSTSEAGCCAACGAPRKRVLEEVGGGRPRRFSSAAEQLAWNEARGRPGRAGCTTPPRACGNERRRRQTGWRDTCRCNAETVPCTVLDPYSGSATTGVAALETGRAYIGVELSPRYAEQSRRRLASVVPLLDTSLVHAHHEEQLELGMEETA